MMESRWDSAMACDATGSRVCNGSGTIPAQTTIWYAVLINQVGREKAQEAQKNLNSAQSQSDSIRALEQSLN